MPRKNHKSNNPPFNTIIHLRKKQKTKTSSNPINHSRRIRATIPSNRTISPNIIYPTSTSSSTIPSISTLTTTTTSSFTSYPSTSFKTPTINVKLHILQPKTCCTSNVHRFRQQRRRRSRRLQNRWIPPSPHW